jgi:hypothetical protein
MTEGSCREPLDLENNILRFHPFMTAVAIGSHGKGFLAVVTGSTGFAPFHLGHAHGFFLACDNFTIVAASAGTTGFGNVNGMAKGGFAKTFDFEGYITWFTFVAVYAIFFRCHAESFHAAMACAAGFGCFHFGHGKVLAAFEIINCVMAYFAIVVVFLQMESVTENNRLGVFEREFDILGFGSTGVGCCEQYNCTSKQQRKMFLHGTAPLD